MRVLLWFFKESGQSGFYVVGFVSFRLYTLHSWHTLHSYILKLIEDSKEVSFVDCNYQYLPHWKFKRNHFYKAQVTIQLTMQR